MTATPETKPLEPSILDEVVIRFAGDSGDGMQLTGDRFTTSAPCSATTWRRCPNFPAEIRAPAGTIAGVSSFQVHISDHDIITPGDAPNVLVAMNPAALKANLGELPPGRRSSSTPTRSTSATSPRSATTTTRSTTARSRVARRAGADDLAHDRGVQGARREAPRRRALEELLRPRASSRGCTPGRSSRRSRGSRRSSRKPAGRATRTSRRSRPGCTSVRPPSCSSHYQVQPAKLAPGQVPQHHRQHRRWRTASSPPASWRACRSSSRRTRSPRRPTSSTSCRSTRTSACARCRPRTRSPPSRSRSAPRSRVTSASPPRAVRASTSSPRRSASPSASSCRC